jgi:transposase
LLAGASSNELSKRFGLSNTRIYTLKNQANRDLINGNIQPMEQWRKEQLEMALEPFKELSKVLNKMPRLTKAAIDRMAQKNWPARDWLYL